MNDKDIIKSVYSLPPGSKDLVKIVKKNAGEFWRKTKKVFWRTLHTVKCQERYMTQPYLIRHCRKCDRMTVTDKRLREAFRSGGMPGLIAKKRELDQRSSNIIK